MARLHNYNVNKFSPEVTPAGHYPRTFWFFKNALDKLRIGSIEVIFENGARYLTEGAEAGPHGVIQIHDNRTLVKIIQAGDLGFAESYIEGWCSSPDLQDLLDVAFLNYDELILSIPSGLVQSVLNRLLHWLRRNSAHQARRNIEAHYDLSNQFYELWLDGSMTYSSAFFRQDDISLQNAQRDKYEIICKDANMQNGDRVLEIGCGWGGFAEYSASTYNIELTGITISKSQLDYARHRMDRLGLSGRVQLTHKDYRDLAGNYDKIVSIEMFEAVGEEYWPKFFDVLNRCMKPNGSALLQIITIEDKRFHDYRKSVDFVQKYIFPGGMLPSKFSLKRSVEKAGLTLINQRDFGDSYSKTLRLWRTEFLSSWEKIEALPGSRPFDEKFKRTWDFYLASCAASFLSKVTDVSHFLIRHK